MAAAATTIFQSHSPGRGKLTKTRASTTVKPILKKLHSAQSDGNSLDLDRSWEEQSPEFAHIARDLTSKYDSNSSLYTSSYTPVLGGNSVWKPTPRDISLTFSDSDSGVAVGAGRGALSSSIPAGRTNFSHNRSTSGASIATSNSGRNSSFVHPKQQTPRASTPPLSYANSLVSLDNGPPTASTARDYSPTIEEGNDLDLNSSAFQTPSAGGLASRSFQPHSSYPRPSFGSQRTNSLSESTPPMRELAGKSSNSRQRNHAFVNHGRSDLQQNLVPLFADTPLSATPLNTSPHLVAETISTSTTLTPASPLRSSLDMSGFRLRSRSELDTPTRQEHVREARRKWEEKEKVKDEKYRREQDRKLERAETKEAHRHERKRSFGAVGAASARKSSSEPRRSAQHRRSTGTPRHDSSNEKSVFSSQGYDTAANGQAPKPRAEDVRFGAPKRKPPKRDTKGAWTAFVLWFRTRLLRIGRRR